MYPKSGDIVDLSTGEISKKSENSTKAKGITGTGVIAAIALGLSTGIIKATEKLEALTERFIFKMEFS
jgi:methylamine methyltransferase corrinoid activation protein